MRATLEFNGLITKPVIACGMFAKNSSSEKYFFTQILPEEPGKFRKNKIS